MYFKKLAILLLAAIYSAHIYAEQHTPDFWKNATVYFMLTDRFNNGDTTNDHLYNRNEIPATLRGFEGGDIKGIIEKIEEGYFTRLGIDAIWMTPLIEQVHGYDESSGLTYSYHGYWPKDWTAVDKNFGTEADLKKMITVAHKNNIKVLMDVIINHTGPETKSDWAWPKEWIRTTPLCTWENYKQNTQCALATSLTDIKTESELGVKLPPKLLEKWKKEGRLEQKITEIEGFFTRTGYPRAPKYYIVKWLTDWVKEYGVDGFRVDTAKHVEANIWTVLKKESELSLKIWKKNNPKSIKDDLPFYMVGEVFNWGLNGYKNTAKDGRSYDYGDKLVDFFDYGFDALFAEAMMSYESDWHTSISFFESYLALNPNSVIAMIYLIKLYLWDKQIEKANNFLEISDNILIKEPLEIANIQLLKGRISAKKKDYLRALQYYGQAIKITDKHQDWFLKASVSEEYGLIFLEQERLNKALQAFTNALSYYQIIQSQIGINSTRLHLAEVLFRQGNIEQAREYYSKANKKIIMIKLEFLYSMLAEYKTKFDNRLD